MSIANQSIIIHSPFPPKNFTFDPNGSYIFTSILEEAPFVYLIDDDYEKDIISVKVYFTIIAWIFGLPLMLYVTITLCVKATATRRYFYMLAIQSVCGMFALLVYSARSTIGNWNGEEYVVFHFLRENLAHGEYSRVFQEAQFLTYEFVLISIAVCCVYWREKMSMKKCKYLYGLIAIITVFRLLCEFNTEILYALYVLGIVLDYREITLQFMVVQSYSHYSYIIVCAICFLSLRKTNTSFLSPLTAKAYKRMTWCLGSKVLLQVSFIWIPLAENIPIASHPDDFNFFRDYFVLTLPFIRNWPMMLPILDSIIDLIFMAVLQEPIRSCLRCMKFSAISSRRPGNLVTVESISAASNPRT